MPESTLILVTESWPLSDDNAVRGNVPHPLNQHQPKPSIQAKARFDAKHNLISDKVAIRLLDSLDPGSSAYVQFIAIRWRGSVSDQSLEETHLEVVPNMECDSILFSASFSDYPEGKFSQKWFCLTALNPVESRTDPLSSNEDEELTIRNGDNDASAFGFSGSDQDQNQYRDSSTPCMDEQNPTSWDLQQFVSDAASHGIHFMNMETVEALTPLWSQAQSGSQLGYPTNNALDRDAHGSYTPYSDSCVWGSTADAYGLDQEWSPSTSQTLCAAFPERLLTCESTQASSELTFGTLNGDDWPPVYGDFMEDLSAGDSTLASGSSGDPASDNASPPRQDQPENFEDITIFDQNQLGDFETHPGHKVWEWVPERARWRRRGGTTEADWFPNFFA